MDASWSTLWGARIVVWTPLPGLDPSLGEDAMRIGAVAFAEAEAQGKPEAECHVAAEAAAYKQHYRVSYAFGNMNRASVRQKNTSP
jgi:hypothetical protein